MLVLSPRAVERLADLQAGLAAAEDLPHDQGRQADRGHLRGRDDQHALDARGRGLSRCAGMGEDGRRPRRRSSKRADANLRVDRQLGTRDDLGRFPRREAEDALQHVGLPEDRRSGGHRAADEELRRPSPRRSSSILEKAKRRLRYRPLPRRAAGPAHLVRRDRAGARPQGADCPGSTGRSTRPRPGSARRRRDVPPSPAGRGRGWGSQRRLYASSRRADADRAVATSPHSANPAFHPHA